MNERWITITRLSRMTGVRSRTIAGYARMLRPIALEIYEENTHSARSV